jgi:hypothetical protein
MKVGAAKFNRRPGQHGPAPQSAAQAQQHTAVRQPARSAPKGKMESRHVLNAAKLVGIIVLYSLAGWLLLMGMYYATIAFLLPPWVAFFKGITEGALSGGNIHPYLMQAFVEISQWIAIGLFAATQFYQSQKLFHSFKFFIIKNGKKKVDWLRWCFYAFEFFVVSIIALGVAMYGWRGNLGDNAFQLGAFIWTNPVKFGGILLTILAQTMAAEFMMVVAFNAGIVGWEQIQENATLLKGQFSAIQGNANTKMNDRNQRAAANTQSQANPQRSAAPSGTTRQAAAGGRAQHSQANTAQAPIDVEPVPEPREQRRTAAQARTIITPPPTNAAPALDNDDAWRDKPAQPAAAAPGRTRAWGRPQR